MQLANVQQFFFSNWMEPTVDWKFTKLFSRSSCSILEANTQLNRTSSHFFICHACTGNHRIQHIFAMMWCDVMHSTCCCTSPRSSSSQLIVECMDVKNMQSNEWMVWCASALKKECAMPSKEIQFQPFANTKWIWIFVSLVFEIHFNKFYLVVIFVFSLLFSIYFILLIRFFCFCFVFSSVGNDLDSIRALFSEKEKELSLAVAKVDALTKQLEELRRDRRGPLNLISTSGAALNPANVAASVNSLAINGGNNGTSNIQQHLNSTSPAARELDKLRRELLVRNGTRQNKTKNKTNGYHFVTIFLFFFFTAHSNFFIAVIVVVVCWRRWARPTTCSSLCIEKHYHLFFNTQDTN